MKTTFGIGAIGTGAFFALLAATALPSAALAAQGGGGRAEAPATNFPYSEEELRDYAYAVAQIRRIEGFTRREVALLNNNPQEAQRLEAQGESEIGVALERAGFTQAEYDTMTAAIDAHAEMKATIDAYVLEELGVVDGD